MRVLVIEDKLANRQSALETLAGHELTILSSFDEAIKVLKVTHDSEKVQRLLAEAGYPTKPEGYDPGYWVAVDRAEAAAETLIPFDAVLTDLMMPMSSQTLSWKAYKPGEQVPYGFVLALLAARRGARYVAVVTDTNHHMGAISAALDHLGGAYYSPGFSPNFTINGAVCMFVHAPFVQDQALDVPCDNCVGGTACNWDRTPLVGGRCPKCEREGRTPTPCSVCGGKGRHDTIIEERKDWGQVLRDLISDPGSEEDVETAAPTL